MVTVQIVKLIFFCLKHMCHWYGIPDPLFWRFQRIVPSWNSLEVPSATWRIIPVSTYLVIRIYKPEISAIWKGKNPSRHGDFHHASVRPGMIRSFQQLARGVGQRNYHFFFGFVTSVTWQQGREGSIYPETSVHPFPSFGDVFFFWCLERRFFLLKVLKHLKGIAGFLWILGLKRCFLLGLCVQSIVFEATIVTKVFPVSFRLFFADDFHVPFVVNSHLFHRWIDPSIHRVNIF